MEGLTQLIAEHAQHAHWYIFGAIVLAGVNIPISADVMIIISALLAANVVPEHTPQLFLSVYLGCVISAWVAYWTGRLLGPKLLKWRYFSKFLNPERLKKINNFYERHGFWTLILGRFIPFGIRNCIFMTAGISQSHFGKFMMRDAFACAIWSSVCFYIFYTLGQNYESLYKYVKTFNLLIFGAFSVTLIAFIWYKKRKKPKTDVAEKTP